MLFKIKAGGYAVFIEGLYQEKNIINLFEEKKRMVVLFSNPMSL